MSFDIISTVVQVKSDGIDSATTSLNNLASAAKNAQTANDSLGNTSKSSSDTMKQSSTALDNLLIRYQSQVDLLGATTAASNAYTTALKGGSAAQQSAAVFLGAEVDAYKALSQAQTEANKINNAMASAVADNQAASDKFIKSLQDQAGKVGLTGQALRDYNAEVNRTKAAQLGVSTEAAGFIQKLQDTEAASGHAGSGISGITRELIVLGHEASQGNFSRFGGSLAVMAEKFNVGKMVASAFGTVMEAVGGSVLVAVGAIAAIAAAIGVVVAGLVTFQHSLTAIQEFNQALILTGGYAGTTGNQLYTMSAAIGQVYGNTGKAREAVMALANTGKFTADQINDITTAAVGLYTYGGVPIDKTIAQFEKLSKESLTSTNKSFDAVTRAAVELDEQLHFLEPSTLAAAIAQEKLGNMQEASRLITKNLSDVETARAEELKANMTVLGTLAHTVGAAFADMWNNLWTKKSPQQELSGVIAQLKELGNTDSIAGKLREAGSGTTRADLMKQAALLQQQIMNAQNVADQKQADAEMKLQGNVAQNYLANIREKEKGETELASQIKKYYAEQAAAQAVGIATTKEQQEADLAYLQKTYGEKAKKVRPEGTSGLNAEIADIQTVAKAQIDANNLQLDSIKNLYATGKIDVGQYADQSSKVIADSQNITVAAYDKSSIAVNNFKDSSVRTAAEVNEANSKLATLQQNLNSEISKSNKALQDNAAAIDIAFNKALNNAVGPIDKVNDGLQKQNDQIQAQIDAYNRLPESVRSAGVTEKQMQDSVTESFIQNKNQELAQAEQNNNVEDKIAQAYISALKTQINLLDERKGKQVTQESQQETNTFNTSAPARQKEEAAKAVSEWQAAGKSIEKALTDSFGKVGTSIGSMFSAYTDYMSAKTAIDEANAKVVAQQLLNPDDLDKNNKLSQAAAIQASETQQAQLKGFADLAGAAAGYFDKNSKGYKVLHALEVEMHVFEMANLAEKLFTNLFVSTASAAGVVAGQATETAAVTAAQNAQNLAKVPGVFMSFMSALGPWGAAAAAVAIAAVLGGAFSGGSGGVDPNSAASRQATQGTGSVLGDPTAQSKSIDNSLTIIAKDSGLGLVHFQSMDNSLKAVVAGLSTLGTNIVQFGNINSLTNQIAGNQSGGWLGSVVSSIFGGNKTVTDAGVSIAQNTVGGIVANGANAVSYNDIHTSGGWFSSGSNSTQTTSLGADANKAISDIIANLSDTIKAAATQLGIGGSAFEDHLKSFVVDIGNISLKGLSGDDVTKALNAVFSKVGDDMAAFAVPLISTFAKIGEGPLETLSRVANDFVQVSDVFAVLGKNITATGLAAVSMSEGLISAFGSIDELTSKTQEFVKDFETPAEQISAIAKSVTVAMAAIGESSVTTIAQFDALVQSQDLTTTAGQQMYAALLNIAPAFKQVADAATQATTDMLTSLNNAASTAFNVLSAAISKEKTESTNAFNAYSTAQNAVITATQNASTALGSLSTALTGALNSLNPLITATSTTWDSAEKTLTNVLTSAKNGGALPTADSLSDTLSVLSKPDDSSYTSSNDYKLAIGITAGKISDLNDITVKQKTIAGQQLLVAQEQLAAATASYNAEQAGFQSLLDVAQQQLNASQGTQVAVEGLVTAISAFNTSVMAAIAASQAAGVIAGTGQAPTVGQAPAPQAATNDQIVSLYSGVLGRAPDAAGLAYWDARAAAGASAAQIAQEFLTSPEYMAEHPNVNGSHAKGLDSVPFDGYTAKLHKGEMVLPAKQAQGVAQGSDMQEVVEAVNTSGGNMNDTLKAMKSDINYLKKLFQQVTPNGQSLQTTTGPA